MLRSMEPRVPARHLPAAERPRALVVVGASAGGVEAVSTLLGQLPADLGAPVLVAIHRAAVPESLLADVFSRAGRLPVHDALDGEPLRAGATYLAPQDRHLLVEDGRVRTPRGPRENGHRPAIDPLFRSAALFYGPAATAIVLTGARDDGAAGAASISRRGGVVIVQDPAEAVVPSMPLHAIQADEPDHIAPLAQIPELVARQVSRSANLSREDVSVGQTVELRSEIAYPALESDTNGREQPPGALVPLSCPDCGGSLCEIDDHETIRLRCRVGHAFSLDSVLERQGEAAEPALWSAVRALEERSSLATRVAERLRSGGLDRRASSFDERSRKAARHAAVLRDVLDGRNGSSDAG